MKIFKLFLILSGLFLLLVTCKTSTEPLKPNKESAFFTLKYRLEGLLDDNYQAKDTTILGVELRTATYFPKDNYTNLQTRTFQKWDYEKGFFIHVDSVYIGCKRQIAALFCKHKPYPGNPYATNWIVYVMRKDTILTRADSVMTFKWPDDTLNAIDKYWLIPY
ncbi:MAG: hypothetical protein GF313_00585 [Caldithrix sp.]|nr:hypothetical protein [Caldithrix sp.]